MKDHCLITSLRDNLMVHQLGVLEKVKSCGIDLPRDSLLLSTGKLMRSNLLFYVADLVHDIASSCGYSFVGDIEELDTNLINLASVIELIHMGSLIHDDIVDNSSVRRNVSTLNFSIGNRASVLIGDLFIAESFSSINRLTFDSSMRNRLFLQVSVALEELINGEMMDIGFEGRIISIDQYFQLIQAKTSTLFQNSCLIPGMLFSFKEDDNIFTLLSDIGLFIGMMFQISDDYNDYFCGSTSDKSIYSDINSRKVTFPLICLYEICDDKTRGYLEDLLLIDSSMAITVSDVNFVLRKMMDYNIKFVIIRYQLNLLSKLKKLLAKLLDYSNIDIESVKTQNILQCCNLLKD